MAGARGRAAYNMLNPPYIHSSSSSAFYNQPTEFVKKPVNPVEFQKLKKRKGDGPDMELRLLVRGRNAGTIIGRSGSNIRRIKQTFGVNLFLSESRSPERILSVMGYFGSICEAILDLIPLIDNNPPSEVTDDVDVRMLMHTSFTRYVIGRKGHGIHDLETKCSTKIQVYHDCCPRSTDRVVQINGRPVDIVNCIAAIVDLVIVHPPVGLILPYNPNNFIEFRALDYGGFTGYDVTVPFQGETVKHGLSSSESNMSKVVSATSSLAKPWTGADIRRSWTPGQPDAELTSSSPCETLGSESFNQCTSWSTETDPNYHGWNWNHSSSDQSPECGKEASHNPVSHGSQGLCGETDPGHQIGQSSTRESLEEFRMSRTRRARPLDECPGLGFFPVDSRTVQVSIPKALQTVVMGRRGAAIRDIRLESRAKIVIEVPPAGANERYLTLNGTPEQLQKAQYLLQTRCLEGKQHFAEDPEGFMNRGIRRRRFPDAPWMTEDIMKMKLMRRKLERVWRAAKTDETRKAFKDYSVEMNKAIRKVKEEYYRLHGGVPENLKKRKLKKEIKKVVDDKTKESNDADSSQADEEASNNCHSSEEEEEEEEEEGCPEELSCTTKAEQEEVISSEQPQ